MCVPHIYVCECVLGGWGVKVEGWKSRRGGPKSFSPRPFCIINGKFQLAFCTKRSQARGELKKFELKCLKKINHTLTWFYGNFYVIFCLQVNYI